MGTLFFKLTWPMLVLFAFVATFSLPFDQVGFSFFLSVAQSAIFLGLSAARPASLALMYWIFSFSFFGLIPWLHYSEGVAIWRLTPLNKSVLVDTNLVIILANFMTYVTHHLAFGVRGVKRWKPIVVCKSKSTSLTLLLFSAIGFLGVVFMNGFDLRLLLFRGVVDQARGSVFSSSPLNLVFSMVSRMLPVFSFYFIYTQLKGNRPIKFAMFGLLFFSVFPTGVARYFVAYTYIPLLMMLAPGFRKGTTFAICILLALLFVFPFLDQFRHFSSLSNVSILPSKQFFFAAHFDAFENFGSAIDAGFVTGGYQLLGALLFFVPRSIWPDKPVGSGYEMAENLGYAFNNISMPFLAEGYINFGFLGVILFAIIMGGLMGRLDRSMAPGSNIRGRLNYRNSVYYFLFGGLFFVFRGDLLSSFAYLTASAFVAWFVGAAMRFVNQRERT